MDEDTHSPEEYSVGRNCTRGELRAVSAGAFCEGKTTKSKQTKNRKRRKKERKDKNKGMERRTKSIGVGWSKRM